MKTHAPDHCIKMRIHFLGLLISIICFPFFPNAWGGVTIIDQDINGDTTWTAAESPYQVSVIINVGDGVTLSVEAGVVVKFETGTGIKIGGAGEVANFVVNGTSEIPVHFTDFRDDSVGGDTDGDGGTPVPGSWKGIGVYGGTATIEYAVIRYAHDGVDILGSSSFLMNNCTVRDSGTDGILWTDFIEGVATFSNCCFLNSGNNGMSILDTTGKINIIGCTVSKTAGVGIYLSDLLAGLGRRTTNVPKDSPYIEIYGSNIFDNGAGILCEDGAAPLIGGSAENRNNIYNNTEYGVQNLTAEIEIDATYNCWGAKSGPYDPESNASGKGNAVSGNVKYDNDDGPPFEYFEVSGFDSDLNNDDAVDLADAITAFQVMTGMSPAAFHPEYREMTIDINGDNRAGLAEAIYILQDAAGF